MRLTINDVGLAALEFPVTDWRPAVPALAASWRAWALAAGPGPAEESGGPPWPSWRLRGGPGRWQRVPGPGE